MALETIQDFERVAKALKDPNSKPEDYRVVEYGFCMICKAVTRCESEGGSEGFNTHCLNCNGDFGTMFLSGPNSHDYSLYLQNIDEIPPKLQKHVDYLHSREIQRNYFLQMLDGFIRKHGGERKTARSQIRKSAKAISGGNAIRAEFGLRPFKFSK